MKKAVIIFLSLLASNIAFSQQKKDLRDTLYKLESKIMSGDTDALRAISKYINDTSFVQEYLGYHNYPNTARMVTLRILYENCLLEKDEDDFDSTMTESAFLKILDSGKLIFDDLTGMFLITPIENRTTTYEIKALSKYDLENIDTSVILSSYPDWYYVNQIDGFLLQKDPQAMKWIASAWFKKRTRFNRYSFDDDDFLGLVKKLTRIDLGVPDDDQKITFLYKDDYNAVARLNYLVYWANHFEDYKWNEKEGYFENTKVKSIQKSREEILFGLLKAENDSVALDAFAQLTELDTGIVRRLAHEYDANNIESNYALPTFEYRFLEQLVLLTRYCRDNSINYKPEGWILESLKRFEQLPSFEERYKLENELIEKLTLDDITAVEYYGLINEGGWRLTYSLGRTLDKFYSRTFHEMATDSSRLNLYLKKAALYDKLGIIGICNKYLKKFQHADPQVIARVKGVFNSTKDPDVRASARKIITSYPIPKKVFPAGDESKTYGVKDFEKKLYELAKTCEGNRSDCGWKVAELVGAINYAQLGSVMRVLMKDSFFTKEQLQDIIENDFGIESASLDEFLKEYDSKDQYHVYEYYFKKTGLNCLDRKGDFIYQNVYETLKYDIVDAFVGGGGGRRDDGIYPLIKMLEFKFRTTLGFPEKLCDAGHPNMICGVTERARAWMQYMEDIKLVTVDKMEPVSISD